MVVVGAVVVVGAAVVVGFWVVFTGGDPALVVGPASPAVVVVATVGDRSEFREKTSESDAAESPLSLK